MFHDLTRFVNVRDCATQNRRFFLALKSRSSLQGGGNRSHTLLIELAKVYVDDKIVVVTNRFPQLTLVSHGKMCSPSPAPTLLGKPS
jgi:hypothetical protein